MASWFRSLTQAFTGVASEDFNTWIADNYELTPPSVPEFFAGSFYAALERAERIDACLLVWLHERRGPLTDALVQQFWASPELRAITQGSQRSEQRGAAPPVLCWAGDACRMEPTALARSLHVERLPVVALLQPIRPEPGDRQRRTRFGIYFVLCADVGPHELLRRVQEHCARRQVAAQMQALSDSLRRSAAAQAEEAKRQAELREQLARQEDEEAPLFCTLYDSEYEGGRPEFLELAFEEAVAEARKQKKLLLCWLRSTSNAAMDALFGGEVWPSEVVQALVSEHFLLWAGDTDRWLGASQLRHVLQLPAVPALVVLQPMSVYEVDGLGFLFGRILDGMPCEHPAGTAWRVLGWLGASSAEALGDGESAVTEFLCGIGEQAQREREQEEAERAARQREADEWRALREAQDREFQESLQADRDAQAKRAADAEASAEQAAAAEAAAAAAAAAPQGPTPLQLRRREAAADWRSKAQPADGRTCRLVVRMPGGNRVERTFAAADTVEILYAWADCAGELAEEVFDVPEHFTLCVTFPRQPLVDRRMTLESAGLYPNAVLAMSPADA